MRGRLQIAPRTLVSKLGPGEIGVFVFPQLPAAAIGPLSQRTSPLLRVESYRIYDRLDGIS